MKLSCDYYHQQESQEQWRPSSPNPYRLLKLIALTRLLFFTMICTDKLLAMAGSST